MPPQRFDIGSKWLLHHQGKGALLVGGFKDVRRIELMPGEIVQNRKYPDGLLRVHLAGQHKPHYVLIEIATYSEKRALRQALDDLTLSYQTLGHLPELLMLVLRPKGRFRISGRHAVRSKLGLSRLEAEWKPVELWTLSAAEFLAQGDVGVTPWVPLMHFDGPPESLLERLRRQDRTRGPSERSRRFAGGVAGADGTPLPGSRVVEIAWRKRIHVRISAAPEDDRGKSTRGHPGSSEGPLRHHAARHNPAPPRNPRREEVKTLKRSRGQVSRPPGIPRSPFVVKVPGDRTRGAGIIAVAEQHVRLVVGDMAVMGQPLAEQDGIAGGRAGLAQPALPQIANLRRGQ